LSKITTLKIIENLEKEGLDLVNLSEREIIRIEKTLKAKIKLDESIDINEVEVIIHLLRKESENLGLFFNDNFKPIRDIIQNKQFIFFNEYTLTNTKAVGVKIKPFLEEYFHEELTNYARKCFESDHYRALYEFLSIHVVLDDKILDNVRKQMDKRFLLISETFRLHTIRKENVISSLINPYFYRCINLLNRDAVYEDRIMDFQNTIINKKDELPKSYFVRMIFCITYFLAFEESNKENINQNHQYSINEGARETHDKFDKVKFKGGSKYKSIRSNYNLTSILRLAFPIIGIILFFNYYSSRNDNDDFRGSDYNKERVLKQLERMKDRGIPHKLKTDDQVNAWEKSTLNIDFSPTLESVKYLQYEEPIITSEKPILKSKDITFSNSPVITRNGVGFLELINVSSDYMILIMENNKKKTKAVIIRPLQIMEIAFEMVKLNVYTGKDLKQVDYLDQNKVKKTGFKFTDFSNKNKKALDHTFTFKGIEVGKYHSVQIYLDENSKTGIGARHKIDKSFYL
jgi:hypothetical protein